METVAAVGLASNILSFVDFGVKVVSKGHRIYRSNDGSLEENNDLEAVTNDLLVLQTRMERSLLSESLDPYQTNDDEALKKLLSASNGLAKTMLQRLNKAKAQGRFRRWRSLRQAVKSVCSKTEVDEMAQRLAQFRAEFQTRIISSISSRLDKATTEIRSQVAVNRNMQAMLEKVGTYSRSVSKKIDVLSGSFVPILNHSAALATSQANESLSLRISLQQSAKHSLSTLIDVDNVPATDDVVNEAVLKAFEYPQMEERYERIPQAHEETFRWILEFAPEDPDVEWDNFSEWLEKDNGIYWIKGKAASGKSTLLKFLHKHPNLKTHLRTWSGGMPLIQADFFFSNLGTPLQKSQSGLLLSLLRKILDQRRDIIKELLPDVWQSLSKQSHSFFHGLSQGWHRWPLRDLQTIFENTIYRVTKATKVFLLVDGLDEFEGDHAEIAEFFCQFASLKGPNIKICLSSRPLTQFEYSFATCKSLRLQDLTARDIRNWVECRLRSHKVYAQISAKNPTRAESMVNEVVTKACGVFLWVNLVVKSLLEGLTNHDTIHDLQERLKDLPPELDALYSAMLRSINPPFYRPQASQLLPIVYQNKGPMSSLALSFASDPDNDVAIKAELKPLTSEQVDERIDAITHRVNSRCRGLLELHKSSALGGRPGNFDHPAKLDEIQYMHLTVKEFLEKPEVWSELLSWTSNTGFDSSVACLRSLLLRLKTTYYFHGWGFHIASLLRNAMSFARQAECSTDVPQTVLVDELDKITAAICTKNSLPRWSANVSGLHNSRSNDKCNRNQTSLLNYAICQGLTLYVRSKFGSSLVKANEQSEIQLLDCATGVELAEIDLEAELNRFDFGHLSPHGRFLDSPSGISTATATGLSTRPIPSMIAMLLELGLSPNERKGGSTPWLRLLGHLQSLKAPGVPLPPVWIDVCKLFILHGADLRSPYASKGTSYPSTADALRYVFSDCPGNVFMDLEILMRQVCPPASKKRKYQTSESDPLPLEERITNAEDKYQKFSSQSTKRRRTRRRG